MKKLIFIFLMLFCLTGCDNSIEFDFKEDINAKVSVSFNLDEYKAYLNEDDLSDEEVKSIIESIIDTREAFDIPYSDLFEEKSYVNNGDYYSGIYEYKYTYSNFVDNSVLNNCFEYFGVQEDKNNLYITAKGKSICAPFKIKVKADNRMLSSNENSKNGNEYIWNVQELNNDIYMTISKTEVQTSSFNVMNVVYATMAIIIGGTALILNKKFKEPR